MLADIPDGVPVAQPDLQHLEPRNRIYPLHLHWLDDLYQLSKLATAGVFWIELARNGGVKFESLGDD